MKAMRPVLSSSSRAIGATGGGAIGSAAAASDAMDAINARSVEASRNDAIARGKITRRP